MATTLMFPKTLPSGPNIWLRYGNDGCCTGAVRSETRPPGPGSYDAAFPLARIMGGRYRPYPGHTAWERAANAHMQLMLGLDVPADAFP